MSELDKTNPIEPVPVEHRADSTRCVFDEASGKVARVLCNGYTIYLSLDKVIGITDQRARVNKDGLVPVGVYTAGDDGGYNFNLTVQDTDRLIEYFLRFKTYLD